MSQPPAIFVTGSGSGTGKTTIAGSLHEVFESRQLPIHCWYEIEVNQRKEFRPFLNDFMQGDDHMVESLKAALDTYVDSEVPDDSVFVSESLVPFLRWLVLGNVSQALIEQYCGWLNERFANRSVTLLALYCRKNAAIARAKKDRGEEWYDQWLFKHRDFPLYKLHPEMDHWSVYEIEKGYYADLGWRVLEFDTAVVGPDTIVAEGVHGLSLPPEVSVVRSELKDGLYHPSTATNLGEINIQEGKIQLLGVWLNLISQSKVHARVANSNTSIENKQNGFLLRSKRFGEVEYSLR